MSMFDDSLQWLINRLCDEIYAYQNIHGEEPRFIMVTTKAYWALENYSRYYFCVKDSALGPIPYFKGIEVRIVSGDGYEIFLAGEPIKLR